MEQEQSCRLYIISPQKIELKSFLPSLEEAFSGGDVAVFQLRMKDASDKDIIKAAKEIIPLCHRKGTAFILNDRPDLAKEVKADGVHLGQEDGPENPGFTSTLKKETGDEFIIGISCYASRHYAMLAGEEGADYVAFGAFYPTKTKEPKGLPTPDILEWWSTYTNIPCVAIGGITPQNCPPLVKAGADFIAVVSAIWDSPSGPGQAVANFNRAIKSAIAKSPAN